MFKSIQRTPYKLKVTQLTPTATRSKIDPWKFDTKNSENLQQNFILYILLQIYIYIYIYIYIFIIR